MPSVWQPVLYSRTRRVDRWWRVKPQRLPNDWLESVVLAVVGRGYDLDRPRFLLTKTGSVRLVGVTCRASSLSETMRSDGDRELYCFVGWCTRDAALRFAAPSLTDLSRDYRQWAGEVYEHWMALDWDLGPRDLREPHNPDPGVAPWDRSGGTSPVEPRYGPPPARREAWPSKDAEALWEWGRATYQDHVIATGWRTLTTVPAALTHVAVDDVPHRRALPPAPAQPRPPATAADPDVEPETVPGSHGKDPLSRGMDVVVSVAEKLFSAAPHHDDHSDDADAPQPSGAPSVSMDPARERLEAAPDSRTQWGAAWGGFREDDEAAAEPEPEPEVAEAPIADTAVPTDGVTLADAAGLQLRSLTMPPRTSWSLTTAAAGLCVALEGSADVEGGGKSHPVNEHLVFRFDEQTTLSIGARELGAHLLIVERSAEPGDGPTAFG